MPLIAIIDYGLGNFMSIQNALKKAGANTLITRKKTDIQRSDALILPGVGAFKDAMKNFEPISNEVLNQVQSGKPLLGICLGLQLLFTESTEGGTYKGLDYFHGQIIGLPKNLKVPHMGWNKILLVQENPLLADVPNGSFVYFAHSYFPAMNVSEEVITMTEYGIRFPSTVSRDHVFATQYHPEKSGVTGLRIINNFVKYVRR